MGNVSQIYSIVNASVADVLGSYAPRATDTTSFVDLGRALANVTGAYDSFFGALAGRIAKTVEFVRLYERNERKILKDYQEFGAFVQRIYTEMPDAIANTAWSVSNGQNPPTVNSSCPYDVDATISISALIFGKRGTWAIEIVRPTYQIKEAFLNESSMMAFIDAIYMTIENSINIELEALENEAVATSMANCLENGCATNLLQVYNNTASTTLTVSNCLHSLDFLAFANKTIDNMRGYMKKMSKKFNVSGYATFTPSDRAVVDVLTEFASASKFYLESNTFHDELVRMEGYNEVPYWQGSGTSWSFEDCSTINIKNVDVKNNGSTPPVAVAVKQTGILAFLRDSENVVAYFGDRHSWELPNPKDDTVIHGEKATVGYAVDPHANAWVFYIAAS